MTNGHLMLRPVQGFLSHPPGIAVLAFAEHMVIEVRGTRLAELAMSRPDSFALLDEATIRLVEGPAVKEATTTPKLAREFAAGFQINAPDGSKVHVGQAAAEAWDQHVEMWRAARAASTGLVGAAPIAARG